MTIRARLGLIDDLIIIELSPLLLILGSVGLVYGIALFNHGLIPSMEPRFAEVVKEMIDRGEYIIPIKNGIPYVEYPPLLYWLGILGKKAGLPMEAAIRLPCYLAFLVWIAALSRLQHLLRIDWPPLLLPITAAALPAILWHFLTAQTDALLITGVMVSFLGYVEWRLDMRPSVRHSRPRVWPFSAAHWKIWGGISLAVAAKGPVGLICTLPIMALELIWAAWLGTNSSRSVRQALVMGWRQARQMEVVRGGLLLVVTTLPWYLLAGMEQGWDFVKALIIYQNFDRYTTGFDHSQPWWYYFGTVLAGLFPFSLLIPVGLWVSFRRRQELPMRLALVWAVFSFVFFSLSLSKQGKYLLPAAPSLLLLALFGVEGLCNPQATRRVNTWLMKWSATVLLIWGLLVVVMLPVHFDGLIERTEFRKVRAELNSNPGTLVHFGWPRSLTLYHLGAPMDYVRSSRELYARIHQRNIAPGDYILVPSNRLIQVGEQPDPRSLYPPPNPLWFEHLFTIQGGTEMQLFRVLDSATEQSLPPTPVPEPLNWRDNLFDTD